MPFITKSEFKAMKDKIVQKKAKRLENAEFQRQVKYAVGNSHQDASKSSANGPRSPEKAKNAYLSIKRRIGRKGLIKKLDVLFSIWIRMKTKKEYGPMCPLCGKRPLQCCFHFITRSKHSVRWDEANAIGSCHSCNFENEFNQAKFINWYQKRFGLAAWDDLFFKSNQIAKFSTAVLQEKYKELKTLVER